MIRISLINLFLIFFIGDFSEFAMRWIHPVLDLKVKLLFFFILYLLKKDINYLIIMQIFIILWQKIDNKIVISYYSLVISMISLWIQSEILHCFSNF